MTRVRRPEFGRSARWLMRVANGFARPSTRSRYLAAARQRWQRNPASSTIEACIVCGASAARVVTITEQLAQVDRDRAARSFPVRICGACGHVGNPANIHDYRDYERIDRLPDRARIGTKERPGREFHMAGMAVDILGRGDLEVLVFGAGRSFDNQHIETLSKVRRAAIADVMKLRDDGEFIDANLPAPRRFDVVIASEVIEHFLEPREDFPHLFDYVKPDGLLVCSTNVYDGGNLSTQRYLFLAGHVSYYTERSLRTLAEANGFRLDLRTPLVATGYGGRRKRYVLLSTSDAVMDAAEAYFRTHRYAPSESPTANLELAARQAAAKTAAKPAGR